MVSKMVDEMEDLKVSQTADKTVDATVDYLVVSTADWKAAAMEES